MPDRSPDSPAIEVDEGKLARALRFDVSLLEHPDNDERESNEGEHGRKRHREGLAERQRVEHAAFLLAEEKNGKERGQNDQERKEQRTRHVRDRAQDDLPPFQGLAPVAPQVRRVQFSTMTIVASTISPMAMKRPASEKRLMV